MKILILSSLAADTGSAVRAAYLADSLKAAGLKVRMVRPLAQSWPLKLDLVITLPWYFLMALKERDDVVMVVKSYPNVGFPLLVKKILGAKAVIDTDDLAFGYSRGWWSRLSKFCQEIFLPLADLHTYNQPELLDYLQRRGILSGKTYQLTQGVDLRTFKNIPAGKLLEIRKKWGLVGKRVMVFVGHFDVACDLGEILKILPPVFKIFPKARLLLVGDGPLRNEFVSLAQKLKIIEKIVWTGLVDRRKVAVLVALADICLLYYHDRRANYYRSSMKLREYLALGKRVICNQLGELKKFEDYTYSVNNQDDFARMIVKILKKGGDGREKKGQKWVQKNCSWEKIGKDFAGELEPRFKKRLI